MTVLAHSPHEQRLLALQRANKVRLRRAQLKRDIAAGRRTVGQVLDELPDEALRMSVSDLLGAQRSWGVRRTSKLLSRVPVSERKPVGALTARQRRELTVALRGAGSGC